MNATQTINIFWTIDTHYIGQLMKMTFLIVSIVKGCGRGHHLSPRLYRVDGFVVQGPNRENSGNHSSHQVDDFD
jgi:hypothetical protein